MNRIIKMITAILCCACVMLGSAVFAHAESNAKAAISAPSSVEEGDSFTVTVKFTSSVGMGSVDAILNYDTSVIKFESGTDAHGTSGAVQLSKWCQNQNSGDTAFTFSLKFTAKSAGSANLSLSGIELSDYNFLPMNVSPPSATVTVKADVPLSANNLLSDIKLSSGSLSPSFSKNTVSYTVNVPNETTTMHITPTCEDSRAKCSVSGSSTLKVGTNTRKITVTAENGSKKTYTVKIIRASAEGEQPPAGSESQDTPPTESENPSVSVTVYVDGVEYAVVEDYSDIEIPDGFTATVCTVNGSQVMAVTNSAETVIMICLIDIQTNASSFFIYDSATITYIPYRTLTVGEKTYIPLIKPRGLALPSGFADAELAIGEQSFSAWINEENNDFYMLYLCNSDGDASLYIYDSKEGTLQRYLNIIDGHDNIGSIDINAVPKQTLLGKIGLYIIIGLAAVILALVIAVIVLAVKRNNKDTDNRNTFMYEFNEDDFAPISTQSTAFDTPEAEQAVTEFIGMESDVSEFDEQAETSVPEQSTTSDSPDEENNQDENKSNSLFFGDDFIIR